MDLSSTAAIKELLLKHGTQPSKGLGQNFLVNAVILEKILAAANITKEDTVLEIGPGIGTLTKELASRAHTVITIEKDQRMLEILKETLRDHQNVKIIHGNALSSTDYKLPTTSYKLVANIPYYLTSPLIRKFLEEPRQPNEMVLMIQKEVAQRICETPPRMTLLSVSVQFYATPKIISYVSKESFWPVPNVDSAIIKIIPHSFAPALSETKGLISTSSPDNFFILVKAGFSQPRKQLANNFSQAFKKNRQEIGAWLLKNDIQPTQRAQTLSIDDWHRLANSYPLFILN